MIVLLAVLMVVLLGVCGLVIDGGNWMVNRREIQNAADAAALAGASQIPSGSSLPPIETAREQYANNGDPSDTVTVTSTTYLTSGDSITVTASRKVDTFFTSIFGLDQVTETATARATVESFTTINGPGTMPWGVLSGSYVPGQPYSIYTKNAGNANNGALSLPYVNGANCPVPNGANSYEDEINGTLQPCPITVGDLLDTKTGDNSGPTAKGLNSRITNWQTADQIVDFSYHPSDTQRARQPPTRADPRTHQHQRTTHLAQRQQHTHEGHRIRLVHHHQLRRPHPPQLLPKQRRQTNQRRLRLPRPLTHRRHQRPMGPKQQHRNHRRTHPITNDEKHDLAIRTG